MAKRREETADRGVASLGLCVQLDEKKKAYREYREARDETRELLVVKANFDRLLNIPEHLPEREPGQPHL